MLLIGSGASTLVHRSVWEVARHGPPRLLELALGLLSFLLASAGILLLIHGRKVFVPAPTGRSTCADAPERDRESRLAGPVRPASRVFAMRRGARRMAELQVPGLSTQAAIDGTTAGSSGVPDRSRRGRHRRG